MSRSKNGTKHPQKHCIKFICNIIYNCGLGNYWYAEKKRTTLRNNIYKAWCLATNIFGVTFIFNEIIANTRNDLTLKERNDLMQFTFGHPTIAAKVIILYLKREDIRVLLKKLLEYRSDCCLEMIYKQSMKRAVLYCTALISVLMFTIFMIVVDAVKAYLVEGIPIRIEVPFYPSAADTGFFVNVLRVLIEIHFCFIIVIMTSIDCLSLCCLVFLGFKFRQVRMFFEGLRKINQTTVQEEEFMKRLIFGIQLHEDALWCARNVQKALGNIYSVQIIESIALLVVCLVRLVAAGHGNMTLFLASLAATICLTILTGSYMMDSADVTHEALSISTAIFHCGWENVRLSAGSRSVLVIAIQCSQVPVKMTAFGVINLSYASFISVLRFSYSFFAVMY
ncbi:uncharacterized protein LOC126968626 [Leptidea sinapis]|uniref:uncharacterized protein LOC126968626 n=1 Tax=Leptidea sinapis TaxID=189913 RepID=UPI0021C2E81F|nr:uncharacterized protein LOC126968626 [Leptidea sinapis]